jgi:hypothetical protein
LKDAQEKVQVAIREALLKSARSAAAAKRQQSDRVHGSAEMKAGVKRDRAVISTEHGSGHVKGKEKIDTIGTVLKKPLKAEQCIVEVNGRRNVATHPTTSTKLPLVTSAKRAANVIDPVQHARPVAAKKSKKAEIGSEQPVDKESLSKTKFWSPKVGDRVASFWPSEGAWFKGVLKAMVSTKAGEGDSADSKAAAAAAVFFKLRNAGGKLIEDRLPSGMRSAMQQTRRSMRVSSIVSKGATEAVDGPGNIQWHLQYDDGDCEVIVWPDETLQRLDKNDGMFDILHLSCCAN